MIVRGHGDWHELNGTVDYFYLSSGDMRIMGVNPWKSKHNQKIGCYCDQEQPGPCRTLIKSMKGSVWSAMGLLSRAWMCRWYWSCWVCWLSFLKRDWSMMLPAAPESGLKLYRDLLSVLFELVWGNFVEIRNDMDSPCWSVWRRTHARVAVVELWMVDVRGTGPLSAWDCHNRSKVSPSYAFDIPQWFLWPVLVA